MVTKNKRNNSNVFLEPLTFQVCGEEPVKFPPGHFGTGPQGRQSSPEPEWIESDTLVVDEELQGIPLSFNFENHPGYLEHWDDFRAFDEPDPTFSDNTKLYRVYDVFIHTAPDTRTGRQLYGLQDFDFGPDKEILVDHSRFAVVALLNV